MDLKTRREIRIKRILGNSENRLKKICSFESKDQVEDEINSNNIQLEENLVQKRTENHVRSKEPIMCNRDTDPLSLVREVLQQKNIESETLVNNHVHSDLTEPDLNVEEDTLQNIRQTIEKEVEESAFKSTYVKNLYKRFFILLFLPCLVRCMFTMNFLMELVSSEFIVDYHFNKIFIPFFMFEIFEYTFYKPVLYRTNNIVACLLSSSIPPQVFDVIGVILRILQDLMVYFFGFVCLDNFINFVY